MAVGPVLIVLAAEAVACRDSLDGRHIPFVFVHVPKTAGSSIHGLMSRAGYYSGYLNRDVWAQVKWSRRLRRVANGSAPLRKIRVRGQVAVYLGKRRFCSSHHLPPKYVSRRSRVNPYCDPSKTFTVLRHPHDRLLSEYLASRRFGEDDSRLSCSGVNDQLRSWLRAFRREWSFRDCHLVPQWEYVYDDGGRRLVNHLLRFSRLSADLARLLGTPALDMGHENQSPGRKSPAGNCSLDADTSRMVDDIYRKDFELYYNATRQ